MCCSSCVFSPVDAKKPTQGPPAYTRQETFNLLPPAGDPEQVGAAMSKPINLIN